MDLPVLLICLTYFISAYTCQPCQTNDTDTSVSPVDEEDDQNIISVEDNSSSQEEDTKPLNTVAMRRSYRSNDEKPYYPVKPFPYPVTNNRYPCQPRPCPPYNEKQYTKGYWPYPWEIRTEIPDYEDGAKETSTDDSTETEIITTVGTTPKITNKTKTPKNGKKHKHSKTHKRGKRKHRKGFTISVVQNEYSDAKA